METANMALLKQGLLDLGLAPEENGLDGIARHLAMVADWNQRVNLTALKEERDMVVKHAVDSAAALSVVQLAPGAAVIDIGTGAGFPGVVMKCLQPSLNVTLLESLGKRCKFLEAVGEEVLPAVEATEGYRVVWGRAEDFGQNPAFREKFDLAVARAVAELRVLAEYCLPFVRVGGEFLAMKGPGASEELAGAKTALMELGGEVIDVREILLPGDAGSRTLIRVRKGKATPRKYPRKAGTPAKTPL